MMNTVKKLVGMILPENVKYYLKRKKSAHRYRKLIKQTYDHYAKVEKQIALRGDKPLRIAAYVVYDSSFAAYELFDLIIASPNQYSAKIVIVPDVARGKDNQISQYNKTKEFFIKRYGADFVFDGWNQKTDEYFDLSDQFDVINLANPYDQMVHEYHGVQYLSKKMVLPIYISYGCMPDNYGCKSIIPMKEISLFWKVFADDKISFKNYQKYELAKGKNVVLSGYAKMDSLVKFSEKKSDRKRIIIAPHHTINNKDLPLSNFLKYSDFFLKLPEFFPLVDFIFRPHPLLFTNLINEGFWTVDQRDQYIEALQKAGIVYSVGGDYFDIFVNSDAMIHDCSSFIVEYLFTGKPCCFMAKKNYKKVLSNLGKSCLENYYLAFTEQQITQFIHEVLILGNDELKEKREKYAGEYLALNYPNVSKKILEEISI